MRYSVQARDQLVPTGNLIGNKIADIITKVPKTSPKNN